MIFKKQNEPNLLDNLLWSRLYTDWFNGSTPMFTKTELLLLADVLDQLFVKYQNSTNMMYLIRECSTYLWNSLKKRDLKAGSLAAFNDEAFQKIKNKIEGIKKDNRNDK